MIILFGALGYFAYADHITGAVALIFLSFLQSLASLVGAVPIAGPILYYVFLGQWVQHWTLGFTGIAPTWVTGWAFWYGLIASVVISGFTTFLLAVWMKDDF